MLGKGANVVLGFVLLTLLAVASVYIFGIAFGFFQSADDNVQASIVAGLFAFCVALVNWNYQRKKAEIDRHKEKKVEVYGKLISFLNDFQKIAKKDGPDASEQYLRSDDFFDFFWDMGRELVLWASPGVLHAFYGAFKNSEQSDAGNILARVDKLYAEIRRDLGLSNWGLKKYDLVGMMVNDIETLRSRKKK